jgi:nicotinate-nucleotide adenylyltransferase
VDIDRDKPTYTVDTLTDLKNSYPDAELFFITGSDAIAQILAWKEVQKLWDLAHFVAVSRPGHTLALPEIPADSVTSVEVPALAISSTDCRARVANGEPIWYLVPDGVVQYIAKHGLYRELS